MLMPRYHPRQRVTVTLGSLLSGYPLKGGTILQADRRGSHPGALTSCRLLTGADALKPAGTPALPGSNGPALSG